MRCPYCTSEISDQALACPHCAHDLYLFKPLLQKIDALEARVAELEKAQQQAAPAAPAGSAGAPTEPATLAAWAAYWLAPLLLLLLAHFAITVAYDLKTLYLRIASLLIPLPFGFLLMRRRFGFPAWSAAALALGVAAAWGMSAVIARVDGTPVLPQDAREWREFIEYAASMGLAYVSGMLLGAHLRRRREHAERRAGELTVQLAKLITSGSQSAEKLNATISKLRELSNSLTVAATSAAAAYAGLKGFIDG